MKTAERSARDILSSWQFWMGVSYFGLVAVVFGLFIQAGRINTAQQFALREQATRVASVRANAEAEYHACLRSIPTLARVNRFVAGVQELHEVLLENAQETHSATPTGSATYAVQERNIVRLRRSVELVRDTRFPVPTKHQCRTLRQSILSRG